MIVRNGVLPAAVLALMFPCAISAQQFTARDAFWSANDLITVAPNPAAHKPIEPTHSHPRQSATGEVSGGTDPNRAGRPSRGNNEVAQLVMTNGYGAAPKFVRAAENRLGLRCSVMLRDANNKYAEVTPGTVFHSGDHIRLSFLANEPGYFYVIQQGSSGTWSPIFPPLNAGPDANKVLAGQPQVVPSGTRAFAFDEHPGDEKLYVILSRTPVVDIDRVIQSLRTGKAAQPQEPTGGGGAGPMMEAKNNIPDLFVQQLASRDLNLVEEQKVDESSKPDVQGEKAIYVVSKGAAPESNSQVVLNLDLRHE
jgi:Domain of unknown function (DUF4384)